MDATPRWRRIQIDDQHFDMLPTGIAELSAEKATELARIFGNNGELRAER